MAASWAGWLLGFALGLRHALEPDHLAAVSTMLVDQPRFRPAVLLGAFWGLGHSAALLAAAGSLLLLRVTLPAGVADGLELCVALMLVAFGARGLLAAFEPRTAGSSKRRSGPAPAHAHGGRRPLLVGVLHGLAGSGALTALVLGDVSSRHAGLASSASVRPSAALAYMALFAVGSMMGMVLLTGVVGMSIARVAQHARVQRWAQALTGGLSLGLGALCVVPLLSRLVEGA